MAIKIKMAIKMMVPGKYNPGHFPAFIVFRQAGILIPILILIDILLSFFRGRGVIGGKEVVEGWLEVFLECVGIGGLAWA